MSEAELLPHDRFLESMDSGYGRLGASRASQATCRMTQNRLGRELRDRGEIDLTGTEQDDWSFSVFSQGDEDGLLLAIFSVLGHGGRRVLDIGSGKGLMGNSANLLVHHRWRGWLVDADARRQRIARAFFRAQYETRWTMPALHTRVLRSADAMSVLTDLGVPTEVDLLSVDIDGDDLWILDALHELRPRVVVVEFQHYWAPDLAVSVPRVRDAGLSAAHRWYMGASLKAFDDLLVARGYELVAISSGGFNAFYVHREENRGRISRMTGDQAAARVEWTVELAERSRAVSALPVQPVHVENGRLVCDGPPRVVPNEWSR
ncbi:hypothetical protein [Umezawaea sp.]|uniref:hypothetical protein n=1 Tax=Umezawaea sp. TaxID=1955258 RepID=UPI002ED131ED